MKHLRRYVGKPVLVQLDEVTFRGVLATAGPDHLELVRATAHAPSTTGEMGQGQTLAGLVYVPALCVQYVQVTE